MHVLALLADGWGIVAAAAVTGAFGLAVSSMNARRIGKPNGHGSVVEMVSTALEEAKKAKRIARTSHRTMIRCLSEQDATLRRIELTMRASLMDRGIPELDHNHEES